MTRGNGGYLDNGGSYFYAGNSLGADIEMEVEPGQFWVILNADGSVKGSGAMGGREVAEVLAENGGPGTTIRMFDTPGARDAFVASSSGNVVDKIGSMIAGWLGAKPATNTGIVPTKGPLALPAVAFGGKQSSLVVPLAIGAVAVGAYFLFFRKKGSTSP